MSNDVRKGWVKHGTGKSRTGAIQCEAVPAPAELVSNENVPEQLLTDAVPVQCLEDPVSQTAQFKKFSDCSKSVKNRKVKEVFDGMMKYCSTQLEFMLDRANAEYPGIKVAMAEKPRSSLHCHCDPLLCELGMARRRLSSHPSSIVRAMDQAVYNSGFGNRKHLKRRGYHVGPKLWKAVVKKIPLKLKIIGRPSKFNSPALRKFIKDALELNSQDSSWSCVARSVVGGAKVRERRRVRTLTGTLTAIYNTSPLVRSYIAFTQFRGMVRAFFPEFKKARMKTDLCDHCHAFRKKIIPRLQSFLQRARQQMEDVCPGYWDAFDASPEHAILDAEQNRPAKLMARGRYLWEGHEQTQAVQRAAAPEPALIRHAEGALHTELKLHQ